MATASRAMSRAVVFCWLCGKPEAFLNTVLRIPNARALRVIRLAKLRSVPEMASATAVATSLADLVTSA